MRENIAIEVKQIKETFFSAFSLFNSLRWVGHESLCDGFYNQQLFFSYYEQECFLTLYFANHHSSYCTVELGWISSKKEKEKFKFSISGEILQIDYLVKKTLEYFLSNCDEVIAEHERELKLAELKKEERINKIIRLKQKTTLDVKVFYFTPVVIIPLENLSEELVLQLTKELKGKLYE